MHLISRVVIINCCFSIHCCTLVGVHKDEIWTLYYENVSLSINRISITIFQTPNLCQKFLCQQPIPKPPRWDLIWVLFFCFFLHFFLFFWAAYNLIHFNFLYFVSSHFLLLLWMKEIKIFRLTFKSFHLLILGQKTRLASNIWVCIFLRLHY